MLVNHGASTMLQFRETTAWQHEVMFCIVYLQFVEFHIPQEIAVAQMRPALGRWGPGQQLQRKLVSSGNRQAKDQVPLMKQTPEMGQGLDTFLRRPVGIEQHRPLGWPTSCKWGVLASNQCSYKPSPPLKTQLKDHPNRVVFTYNGVFLLLEDSQHYVHNQLDQTKLAALMPEIFRMLCVSGICSCCPQHLLGLILHPGITRRKAVCLLPGVCLFS